MKKAYNPWTNKTNAKKSLRQYDRALRLLEKNLLLDAVMIADCIDLILDDPRRTQEIVYNYCMDTIADIEKYYPGLYVETYPKASGK